MQTCSTRAAAFVNHGITDGSDLISRTYYKLAADGQRDPKPTAEFANRLATAFRWAFIQRATVPLVPEPIDAAVEEATDTIVHRILDDPDADLRTEILPTFYRSVAEAYCAHLEAGGDPGEVSIQYDDHGSGGMLTSG